MSLLSLVKRFAAEVNIESNVTTVMGTTDPQIIQIRSILETEGRDLSGRGDWEALVNEATITFAGITGTVDSVGGSAVVDSDATFTSDVSVGDYIYNTSTGEQTTISAVPADNIINITEWPLFSAGDTYTVVTNDLKIDQIASNGFRYIKNDTIWDRDLRLPVYVIDGTDWQQVLATGVTGPRHQARIRGGILLVNPAPTIGNKWAFEYATWNWLTDSTGVTQKQYFTDDGDLMLLPEFLLEAGLMWRWKKHKGMEYSEDFRTYEMLVANELSRNGIKRAVNLHQSVETPRPKVLVPDGSWNV